MSKVYFHRQIDKKWEKETLKRKEVKLSAVRTVKQDHIVKESQKLKLSQHRRRLRKRRPLPRLRRRSDNRFGSVFNTIESKSFGLNQTVSPGGSERASISCTSLPAIPLMELYI